MAFDAEEQYGRKEHQGPVFLRSKIMSVLQPSPHAEFSWIAGRNFNTMELDVSLKKQKRHISRKKQKQKTVCTEKNFVTVKCVGVASFQTTLSFLVCKQSLHARLRRRNYALCSLKSLLFQFHVFIFGSKFFRHLKPPGEVWSK